MILQGLRDRFNRLSATAKRRITIGAWITFSCISAAVTVSALHPRERTDSPFWWPASVPDYVLGIVFVTLVLGYMAWILRVRRPGCLPAAVTAGVLSAAAALSSFVEPGLNSLRPLSAALFLHRALGAFPVGYALLTLLFRALDRFHDPERSRERGETKRKTLFARIPSDRKRARRVFALVLAVCWLPVILLCFPGNLTGDTHKSVRSALGEPEAAVNMPWFLNLLHGGAIRLGGMLGSADGGLFLVCMLQAVLFLCVFADFLGLMAEHGVPKGILVCAAALFALWPVFSTYAFSTVKDAVFTLWLLFFSKCLTEILLRSRKDAGPAFSSADRRVWIALGLSALMLSISRNGAVWIALLSLVWLFFRLPHRRPQAAGIAASALILALGVPAVFGFGSVQIRENLSLPLQQTARVLQAHEARMTQEELTEYEAVMPLEDWAKYEPGISDPVKSAFAAQPDSAYLRRFFSLWAREGQRHPGTYAEAGILMSYGYWTPLADRSDLKERLFLGTRRFKVKTFTKTIPTLTAHDGEQLDLLVRWDEFLNRVPVLRLLSRIGIYSWGLIAALIYCLCRKGRREYAVLLLPLLIVLIGCCLSPVNGHYRYGFPLIAGTPLLGTAALFLRPSSASGPRSS